MTPGQAAYEAAVRVMLGDDTTASDDGGPDFAWNAIGSIERDSWEAAAFAAAPAFAAQLANVKRIVVASGKTHAWKIRQLLALVGEIPAPDDDEPKAAPGRECNALEEIARAVQGCTDAGIPHDYEWILEQALDGLGWLPDEWERRKPEPKPAPELAAKPMPRVDWARVSEAVADRERERDALRELATEIIAEVSGWTRDPLDTDQLIADWRKRAAPHPENPVTGWTPGGVAPELAAAMRESRIRADVVTELLGMFKAVSGGWAARTSSKRLKRIAQVAGVHWDGLTMPAPDSDDLTELRHGITGLARDRDASAKATSPSRKSDIESETAIALRKLLET